MPGFLNQFLSLWKHSRRAAGLHSDNPVIVECLEDRLLLTIDILFDYTYDSDGFFNAQSRRDVLEAAAADFENRITDDLTAISPSGSNTWNAVFNNPTTNAQVTLPNLAVPADTIIVYVGARNLPSGLGLGGPGGFNALASPAFLENLQTRGEAGVDPNSANDTDFSLWGGTIAFDNAVTWNFSLDEPVSGQNDLYSVALHEIGHVLGFGTAESFRNQINGANNFTGPESVAVFGGPVPMSFDSNGNPDSGHFIEDTISVIPGTSIQQESAMDPQVTTGTRKEFTKVDWAALDDLGWELTTVDDPVMEGNVDGDSDFDSNDSFLIQLVQLAGSNQQIDSSKGGSPLTATQIRTNIAALQTAGDVDGDGEFDANDAFLIHLIKLAGANSQIDDSKGSSSLTASQIRANVDALGSVSGAGLGPSLGQQSPSVAAVYADSKVLPKPAEAFKKIATTSISSNEVPVLPAVFETQEVRSWLAAISS